MDARALYPSAFQSILLRLIGNEQLRIHTGMSGELLPSYPIPSEISKGA